MLLGKPYKNLSGLTAQRFISAHTHTTGVGVTLRGAAPPSGGSCGLLAPAHDALAQGA